MRGTDIITVGVIEHAPAEAVVEPGADEGIAILGIGAAAEAQFLSGVEVTQGSEDRRLLGRGEIRAIFDDFADPGERRFERPDLVAKRRR